MDLGPLAQGVLAFRHSGLEILLPQAQRVVFGEQNRAREERGTEEAREESRKGG